MKNAARARVPAESVHVYRNPHALVVYLVEAVALYHTKHAELSAAIVALAADKQLSLRDVELFALGCTDLSHPEIGRMQGLTINTLKTMYRRLCRRLGERDGVGHAAYRLVLDALKQPPEVRVPTHLLMSKHRASSAQRRAARQQGTIDLDGAYRALRARLRRLRFPLSEPAVRAVVRESTPWPELTAYFFERFASALEWRADVHGRRDRAVGFVDLRRRAG